MNPNAVKFELVLESVAGLAKSTGVRRVLLHRFLR